jgi:hypothetical protein
MHTKLKYKVSRLWAPGEAIVWAESHYDALVAAAALFYTTINRVEAVLAGDHNTH